MRLLKSQSLLRLVNSYMIDSPQPANISYMWNFGSLLGVCLIIQILTGVFLAMHYTPHVDFAFNSVEHIMRDVNAGYILRYTHANVASFFFMFVYALLIFYIDIYRFSYENYLLNSLNTYLFNIKDFFQIKYLYFINFTANVKDKFTTHSIFTLILNNLNTKLGDNEIILRTGNDQHDFLNWFVGFTDAEGCFLISTPKIVKKFILYFKLLCILMIYLYYNLLKID